MSSEQPASTEEVKTVQANQDSVQQVASEKTKELEQQVTQNAPAQTQVDEKSQFIATKPAEASTAPTSAATTPAAPKATKPGVWEPLFK